MSQSFTPTQVADMVTWVDGEHIDSIDAHARAIVRNPGAEVVNVDVTLTDVFTDEQTKFKITIERTSTP